MDEYTIEQVAEMMKVSVEEVRRLIAAGELSTTADGMVHVKALRRFQRHLENPPDDF